MTQSQLEGLAYDKKPDTYAQFLLGKHMIEGGNPRIAKNETRGLNLVKDAAKAGNIDAVEYKTYYDIRFEARP